MKIIYFSIIFSILIVGIGFQGNRAYATGSVVQMATSTLQNVTSVTVNFLNNLTAGNALILCARYGGVAFVTSATTTQSDTYTLISSSTTGSAGTDGALAMYYAANIAGGKSSTTVVITATSNMQLAVAEVSGLSTASPLDQFSFQNSTNNGGVATTFGSGLTATTTQASEYLAYCGTSVGGNGNAWSAVSPYTIQTNSAMNRMIYEDNNVTSTAKYSASSTQSASQGWVGGIAAFKETIATSPIKTYINRPPYLLTVTSGLVGHWTFDGFHTNWAAGQTFDQSGNGNTGTLTNMSTSTTPFPGKLGQALKFDGVDDYVGMGDVLGLIGSGMSLSAWIKPDTPVSFDGPFSYGGIVDKLVSDGNYRFMVFYGDSNTLPVVIFGVRAADSTYEQVVSNSSLNLGQWYHVIATYDNATTGKIYINGVLDNTKTNFSVSRGNTAQGLTIGRTPNNATFLHGSLDDIRVYNRILSDKEALQLYNFGAVNVNSPLINPGSNLQKNLVGWWTLDGQVTNWATGQTFDQSGAGNTGTLTNMSTLTTPFPGKFGQAFLFDGVDDFISGAFMPPLSGDFSGSFCAWVNLNTVSVKQTILSMGGGGVGEAFNMTIGERDIGAISAEFYGGNPVYTNTIVPLRTWSHVCITKSPGLTDITTKLYYNGVSQAIASAASLTPNLLSGFFSLGQDGNDSSGRVNGLLDDIRVYNRTLSAPEVLQLYRIGSVNIKQ